MSNVKYPHVYGILEGSVLRHVVTASSLVVLLILFIGYHPGLVEFDPQPYSVNLPTSFEGPLAINEKLSEAEHLFTGKLQGPESIAFYNGKAYTGTSDGQILEIHENSVRFVTWTGKNCAARDRNKKTWNSRGRPLGLKFDSKGNLYVADAFCGLLKVDVTTGAVEQLLPILTVVEGKAVSMPDDLAIDEQGGIIYFTDSTTRWSLRDLVFICLEHENSGRVIAFNLTTNQASVIADNMYFPNGIQLSHDGSYLLISEWSKFRIMKYYLKGEFKGELKIFIENLPGEPDNIRPSTSKGYWITLTGVRSRGRPSLVDISSEYPFLRKLVVRTSHLLGSILEQLHSIWPLEFLIKTGENLCHLHYMFHWASHHGLVIEVDGKGNINRSLHSPDGRIPIPTEASENNGHLYVGSYFNDFIARSPAHLSFITGGPHVGR
ncbi:adipocyte plasma membrane-associated protein-like isoform X2 [Tachypleus tridentatus]|uniref:adipocyte plasma membrane-associated protein-like isoform X2 n=1 Tax=Tachypleus tridentatus TaxID=6853 RepID=UPI003FD66783